MMRNGFFRLRSKIGKFILLPSTYSDFVIFLNSRPYGAIRANQSSKQHCDQLIPLARIKFVTP